MKIPRWRHKWLGSLRYRVMAGSFGVVFLLLVILLFNNYAAINTVLAKSRTSNQNTLRLYMQQIDASYSDIESFLSARGYNNANLQLIERQEDTLRHLLAVQREQIALNQAIPGYSTIDGLFVAAPTASTYIEATQPGLSKDISRRIRALMTRDGGSACASLYMAHPSRWFVLEDHGDYYLSRIVKIHETYAGAWVRVNHLLEPLEKNIFEEGYRLFFMDTDGTPLDARVDRGLFGTPLPELFTRRLVAYDGENHLLITQQSRSGDFLLAALVSDRNLTADLTDFYRVLPFIALGVLLSLLLLGLAMNRLMVRPLQHLTAAIHALKAGNLDAKIEEKHPCEEFIEVNQAFHDMTTQIKTLKINVYEEQLSLQQARLLQLQQQLAPHFLINCLSTVYFLSDAGDPEMVKELSTRLSEHLRYALMPDYVVPLSRELQHVRNYVEIGGLRYPDAVRFVCDPLPGKDTDPQSLGHVLVPPLLLQTFVENSLKHEVAMGELLELHLTMERKETVDGTRLLLTYWDTGTGYSPDMLAWLSEPLSPQTDGEHVGLRNIRNRVAILYRGAAAIRFSNRPGAGAMVEMDLPCLTEALPKAWMP